MSEPNEYDELSGSIINNIDWAKNVLAEALGGERHDASSIRPLYLPLKERQSLYGMTIKYLDRAIEFVHVFRHHAECAKPDRHELRDRVTPLQIVTEPDGSRWVSLEDYLIVEQCQNIASLRDAYCHGRDDAECAAAAKNEALMQLFEACEILFTDQEWVEYGRLSVSNWNEQDEKIMLDAMLAACQSLSFDINSNPYYPLTEARLERDEAIARAEQAEANAKALREDELRLDWLIDNSALDNREGNPIQLIITKRAVRACSGTWLPEYHQAVRNAIDTARAAITQSDKGKS